MGDILQEALEWTIPEVVVEAEQEMREERAALQRAVLQHASTLIESVMSGSEEAQSFAVSLSSSTDIPQPSEPVEASAPPGAKGTSTVSAPITVYQDITPVHSEESAMEVQVQVEGVPQEAGEGTIKDSEEERLKDPFIQGTIAPKLTTVEQQKLHQDSIYLVIATKMADNLFVTQLAHDMLTLKQQAEIRQKEGEILIIHIADDYKAAHMSLDPQWLQEQIRLRNEQQEGLPLRVFEEVPESLRRMRKRVREETNVAVATSEELVEEPEEERDEDLEESELEEDEESEEEGPEEGASIGEMLDVMGGEAPHAKVPKRRKLTSSGSTRRVSVTREEETGMTEAEPSTTRTTRATGKNLVAMRQQMADDTGCSQSELRTPKGYKESLYGQERGSTHMWGGKGRVKTGQRRKKKVPVKKTAKTMGQEGWQDPDVLRALRGEAPSGVRRALDDACKRKYSGRMIHSTKRGV